MIRNLMLRMISLNGNDLARRRVPRTELVYPQPFEQQVQVVIDRFVAARLLTTGIDTENRQYVEPVHDVLVTGWQKLLISKQEKEESLLLQRRLTPAAWEWQRIKNKLPSADIQVNQQPSNDSQNVPPQAALRLGERLQQLPWLSASKSYPGKQFLWNGNPYLEVLYQEFQSDHNWLNQTEAEFVRQSFALKRHSF